MFQYNLSVLKKNKTWIRCCMCECRVMFCDMLHICIFVWMFWCLMDKNERISIKDQKKRKSNTMKVLCGRSKHSHLSEAYLTYHFFPISRSLCTQNKRGSSWNFKSTHPHYICWHSSYGLCTLVMQLRPVRKFNLY